MAAPCAASFLQRTRGSTPNAVASPSFLLRIAGTVLLHALLGRGTPCLVARFGSKMMDTHLGADATCICPSGARASVHNVCKAARSALYAKCDVWAVL